ncbi:hypothetical protein FBQ87_09085 [Sphingobacteriales bacterium CHB3]|nr:hypothetical protein [Sphingobacteriales bacterium CHB3]
MSKRHPIVFRQINKTGKLPPQTVQDVHTIVTVLRQLNASQSRDFVFRGLPFLLPHNGGLINVRTDYLEAHGKRALSPDEELLCACLQRIVDSHSGQREQVRGVIASIVEFYWFSFKKSDYKSQVLMECILEVNGVKVKHLDREEIDVAVDAIDSLDAVHMAECTINARRFQKKEDQIFLYAKGFEFIREVMGDTTELRFELVAGYSTPRGFVDVSIPNSIEETSVEVVGISIVDGREEILA